MFVLLPKIRRVKLFFDPLFLKRTGSFYIQTLPNIFDVQDLFPLFVFIEATFLILGRMNMLPPPFCMRKDLPSLYLNS